MNAHFHVAAGDVLYAQVDLDVYPLSALLKVAHRFTDRCYLHLQFEGSPTTVGVRLRSKVAGRDESALVGRFMNELLDQTLREDVARQTEPVRNLILAHALSDARLIRPDLEDADPSNDPLGAAVPDAAGSSK